ncbi:MAG: hypothetical protein GYA24_18220 [Candidatus Lokiarchaeota archaeon]|nr:hypothetical protein [Candidatus Lokiarchaeota archaeon]
MDHTRDFFGFSLWHELLAGNGDWMSSLELGDPREFDPEEDGFKNIFARLERVRSDAGLTDMGACFHVSSDFAAMLVDPGFNLLSPFNVARESLSKRMPFELGMHCTFGLDDLPLAGKYPSVLKRDLALASAIGATCVVCHPPKGLENRTGAFVDELVSPRVIDAIESNPGIMLAWENAGADSLFGSLARLLEFKDMLADNLAAAGQPRLMEHHVFCLDTGHLLVWKYKGKQGKRKAEKEIEDALPVFAKRVKVFHIHANDGTGDFHLVPGALDHFDHPTRKTVDKKRFIERSSDALGFLETCERNKGIGGRHVHVEALRLPFTLGSLGTFGKAYLELRERVNQ